jgi:hypothetical protein
MINLDQRTGGPIRSCAATRIAALRAGWSPEMKEGSAWAGVQAKLTKGNQMKFIMSLIAVAALSSVASVFAQEEESPSPAPDEKASATVEDKPAATATPEQTKAQKKEETTATKSESPAAEKKETTTTATKSASPAAATASRKGMSTEAALRDMENKWEEAITKHDTATVESMMSEDFIGVNSKNKVGGRRSVVAEVKSDKDTLT